MKEMLTQDNQYGLSKLKTLNIKHWTFTATDHFKSLPLSLVCSSYPHNNTPSNFTQSIKKARGEVSVSWLYFRIVDGNHAILSDSKRPQPASICVAKRSTLSACDVLFATGVHPHHTDIHTRRTRQGPLLDAVKMSKPLKSLTLTPFTSSCALLNTWRSSKHFLLFYSWLSFLSYFPLHSSHLFFHRL